MTVAQLISDLDELVDIVHRRLGKTKVVLFGHSWGSALGPLYAARFPRRSRSTSAAAQIGDWPAADRHAMRSRSPKRSAAATKRHEEAAHDRTTAVSAKSVFIERTCLAAAWRAA